MQKPQRNNSQTGRIFSLPQNKIDFAYQKDHQPKISQKQPTSPTMGDEPVLLTLLDARKYLKDLCGWTLTVDHKRICCELVVNDFITAVGLIDRIAVIAEQEKHHPDIHLTDYRNLRIVLTSHDMGGLSTKDFVVARKINELPILFNEPSKLEAVKKEKKAKVIPLERSIGRMDQPVII